MAAGDGLEDSLSPVDGAGVGLADASLKPLVLGLDGLVNLAVDIFFFFFSNFIIFK